MTFIDFTKAHYHLENLKQARERAKNSINPEDISIEFLYNCMEEKLSQMKDKKELYENIKSSFFSGHGRYYKIESDKTFYIFKTYQDLVDFLNNNKQFSYSNVIRDIAVFVNNKNKLYVPESEITAIKKDYIYLGKYNVIID